MLIKDRESVSNIVNLTKRIYRQKIATIFETDSVKEERLINTLQGVLFWLVENFEDENLEFPLGVTKYKKIKKLYEEANEPYDDKLSNEINSFIKDILLKDTEENEYYNIISEALFGKDLKNKNHLNEIFVLSLTSKYKNIGFKEIAVVFKEHSEILIMDDGVCFECDLESFLKNFFGSRDNFDFSAKARQYVEMNIPHFAIQEKLNDLCAKHQKMIENDYDLVYGAVMFCDFLGWKGLWKNDEDHAALKDANSLVGKIAVKFEELTNELLPLNKYFPISNLISISDTIALMTPMVNNIIDKPQLFSLYSEIGKFILENSIKIFPLRGAFTIGLFNYTNNIMIGPAIDEAASWHEMADWIGIILAPTAQFEYDIIKLEERSEDIVEYKNIPLKINKGSLKYCLNWDGAGESVLTMVRKNKALIPEIANKYINTYNFLNAQIDNGDEKDGKH